ncbi:MAG: TIR domain-containing protein, partial [Bacteroidales bacterium]|nr:TIR domain-containing protein [Bacteroidales bacterium]
MNIDKAKNIILELLKKEGKATSSKMLRLLDANEDLLKEVCEELIMDDVAADKGGAGLIYIECQKESFPKQVKVLGDNIFISYGRKDAVDFARNIRKDLINNGYEVWMDETDIEAGGLWEVRIEKGIYSARVVLAVITPHSVRETSVCRDEIIFAINNGKEVIPLKIDTQVYTTLMLSRRNWIDFASDYNMGLHKLIDYLKGEIKELQPPVLPSITGVTPFDFSYEIANFTAHFVGREWLNKEIDGWIEKSNSRAMIISGEAGIGKSAIAAWLSQERDTQVVSIHFCTRRNMRTLDPFEYVAALSGQLATQIPEYYEIIKDLDPEKRRSTASLAFRELVSDPLNRINTTKHTKLLIIDSLDEAILQAGESVLNVVINEAAKLPDWIRLICTTRPEEFILNKIRHLKTYEFKAGRKENLEDVANYINEIFDKTELPLHLKKNAKLVKDKLNLLANGNFLYVKMALDALIHDNLPISKLEDLKGKLSDFYLQIFRKRFEDIENFSQRYAPLLSVLVASQGPLSIELLSSCLGIDGSELRLRLQPLRIYIRRIASPGKVEVVFQHKSLRDWLVNESEAGIYKINHIDGHILLAESLMKIWKKDMYALRFLPVHLIGAQRWDDLTNLLCDLDFIQEKAAARLTYDLVEDINNALKVIPDNAENIRKEKERQARLNKYAKDLVLYAKGEIKKLEVPKSITPWSEEKISAEIERIKTNPTHTDKLKDFYNFLGHEAGNLQNYAYEFPHHTTQLAWNYAKNGPVGKAAEKRSQEVYKSLLLRTKPTRPAWNPLPQMLQILKEHTNFVSAVSITLDGKRAISGSEYKTCILWDLTVGEAIQIMKGHTERVSAISITPDGKRAISGSWDKTCIVWDLKTGEVLQTL